LPDTKEADDADNVRRATEAWEAALTRSIAAQVKARRDALGLRAQDLADRCLELGVHLPRGTIAKLESGTRRQITVPEVVALAAALRVSPALLLAPISTDTRTMELLPGRPADVAEVYAWIVGSGGTPPGVDYDDMYSGEPWRSQFMRDEVARRMVTDHRSMVSKLERVSGSLLYQRKKRREQLADEDAAGAEESLAFITEVSQDLDETWDKLRRLRLLMEQDGHSVPSLPSHLAEREASPVALPWGMPRTSPGRAGA
jgi:transcriptional regulator with XRE-family HTH domain